MAAFSFSRNSRGNHLKNVTTSVFSPLLSRERKMVTPTLTLTYPDLHSGKVRLLAVTHDSKVLAVFKQAVLDKARLDLLSCEDEILRIEYQEELNKLEKLLNALIPDRSEANNG